MEREEFDQVMAQKVDYDASYRKAYGHVIWADEPEEIIINESPEVNYDDFSSIGYYDGFNYATWCVMSGRKYDVPADNLVAEMDKSFTQALKRHAEYLKNNQGRSK